MINRVELLFKHNPEHYAIQDVQKNDYLTFIKKRWNTER